MEAHSSGDYWTGLKIDTQSHAVAITAYVMHQMQYVLLFLVSSAWPQILQSYILLHFSCHSLCTLGDSHTCCIHAIYARVLDTSTQHLWASISKFFATSSAVVWSKHAMECSTRGCHTCCQALKNGATRFEQLLFKGFSYSYDSYGILTPSLLSQDWLLAYTYY